MYHAKVVKYIDTSAEAADFILKGSVPDPALSLHL
jgi:hypothetical protein